MLKQLFKHVSHARFCSFNLTLLQGDVRFEGCMHAHEGRKCEFQHLCFQKAFWEREYNERQAKLEL